MLTRWRGLVGRRWAIARIADWYKSSEQALVVTGAAGTGKTALVTNLATRSSAGGVPGAVRAVHRCRNHVIASTDPIRVVASIAAQLAQTVPEYADTLSRLRAWERDHGKSDPATFAKCAALDSTSPSVAYERMLRWPFTEMASARRRDPDIVVVVDGLDECPPTLACLLSECLQSPVPGLRLLLATRPGPALEPLRALARLDLASDCPAGIDDVGEYLETLSGLRPADRSAIAAVAGGSYPCAQLAARMAESGLDVSAAQRSASDPDSLYDQALAAVGDPDSRARLVLSVLALSRDAGLSASQLAGILDVASGDVSAELNHLRHLLTAGRQVRPYHRCIAERICALNSDPGAVDWMIGGELWRLWHGRGVRCGHYTLRYLLPHLADAAAADADCPAGVALSSTATDFAYLAALLDGVGVDDLVTTLSYVVSRLRLPPTDLCDVSSVFRRQASTLRRASSRAAMMTQLLYESATDGATRIARQLAAQVPEHAIVTMWATSDSPLRLTLNPVRGHSSQVTSLAVTSDATRAVSASADGTTRVWRLASGRVVHERPAPERTVGLYASPDTPFVVAATADGSAQVLDADTGDAVTHMKSRRVATVTAFAVAADGTWGVSGDVDGNATVWDLAAGEPTRRLPCRLGVITSVAVTADGRTAAAASMYGDVIVWDLASGTRLAGLQYPGSVSALALTPDGGRVLVCGDELVVHDLTNQAAPTIARLVPNDWITAVAVNPLMPAYALIGTAFGQVAYLRLPSQTSRRAGRSNL